MWHVTSSCGLKMEVKKSNKECKLSVSDVVIASVHKIRSQMSPQMSIIRILPRIGESSEAFEVVRMADEYLAISRESCVTLGDAVSIWTVSIRYSTVSGLM